MLVVEPPTDQALDAENRVVGVCDGLPLRGLAHKALVVGKRDNRRRRTCALGVFDNAGLAAVHDRDAAVGGSKVDANYFGHDVVLSFGDTAVADPKSGVHL